MSDKPASNPPLVKIMGLLFPAYILTSLIALVTGTGCILLATPSHSWLSLASGAALLLYGSYGVGVFLATARAGSALSASQSILGALSMMARSSDSEETH